MRCLITSLAQQLIVSSLHVSCHYQLAYPPPPIKVYIVQPLLCSLLYGHIQLTYYPSGSRVLLWPHHIWDNIAICYQPCVDRDNLMKLWYAISSAATAWRVSMLIASLWCLCGWSIFSKRQLYSVWSPLFLEAGLFLFCYLELLLLGQCGYSNTVVFLLSTAFGLWHVNDFALELRGCIANKNP